MHSLNMSSMLNWYAFTNPLMHAHSYLHNFELDENEHKAILFGRGRNMSVERLASVSRVILTRTAFHSTRMCP